MPAERFCSSCSNASASKAEIPSESRRLLSSTLSRSEIFPSIVAYDKHGNLQVCDDALAYIDLPGYGAREVKRLMGTDAIIMLNDIPIQPVVPGST